jgi:CRP-like cAMP-binding protein
MEEGLDKYPATKLVRFAQGAILFEEGSNSREMYILRSGRVRVSITKNGRSVPITELGKGCHVGEMSFIAAIPRTATVTALETVIANRISPDIISGDALSISGWAISIARVLVDRIKRTTDQLGDYMANGPHPFSAEASLGSPGRVPAFSISQSASDGTIRLAGVLNKTRIDDFKDVVRKSLVKYPGGIVIDFSGIIDIDADVLGYLVQLSVSPQAKDGKIQLRNMQLIRNKVSNMKEIQNLIEAAKLPVRRLEAGEYLIRQGERERSMFVIRSGELDILDEREGHEPIKLGRAAAGDVVGEMSLLKEGVRSASVRAVKPGLVSEITPKEFYSNSYTVPDWFMHILDGLVVRLRNTNEMLEHVSSIESRTEEETVMPAPLTIELDATVPGRFLLAGTMTLANMELLVPMIRHLMYSGQKEITIKMDKIQKIDKDSIRYLLNLYMVLKENGGSLNLIGTQKQLLWLKEQRAENRIAGFSGKDGNHTERTS